MYSRSPSPRKQPADSASTAPVRIVPEATRYEDGPDKMPNLALFEAEFFAVFKHLRPKTMVLDRVHTTSLGDAMSEVLTRPEKFRPNGKYTAETLEHISIEMLEEVDADFADGQAFAQTFSAEGEPVYFFVQPISVDGGMMNPVSWLPGSMPWHKELFRFSEADQLDGASLAAWHEFGHVLFEDQNFEEHTTERIHQTRAPSILREDMLSNAEETFSDSYAIGLIMRPEQDRPKGSPPLHTPTTDILRNFIHLRVIHAISHITIGSGGLKHVPNPHWRNLARNFAQADAPRDHIGIGEMAMEHVIDRQPSDKGYRRIVQDFWDLNPDGFEQKGLSGPAFLAKIGKVGKNADHANSYVLARDYLEVLDQRLPAQDPIRKNVEKARETLQQNPKSALWDRRFPGIEATLSAISLTRKRTATAQPKPGRDARPPGP